MNNIQNLHEKLLSAYGSKMTREELLEESCSVFISGKHGREYYVFAGDDLVRLLRKRRFLKWEFLEPVSHVHCEEEEDTTDWALEWVCKMLEKRI